ncbi:MAG TPA: adenosine deaminase [Nitrososphaerales archaeon]|nr:adenosine deaminase [Nitrososphaerales archaeon]
MQLTQAVIRRLPKADLHSHIDGSLPPSELFRIAREFHKKILTPKGDELDSVTAVMRYVRGDGYASMLENVVDRFYPITNLLQTEEMLKEAGSAYIKTQGLDGVRYAEGRFAPQYHTKEGLPMEDVIESMAEGLAEGGESYGVKVNLIVAIGRESTSHFGEAVAKAAINSKKAVALDLGGPEAGNPPQRFRKAFVRASAAGLKATVHAGEGAGSIEQNLRNIRTAVNLLGANRVGHAIHLVRSDSLVQLVNAKCVAVEMNPISNLVLQKIATVNELRLDVLLRKKVMVSVNSDDPALWPGGKLSQVYAAVCQAYSFRSKELRQLVENSINGSFASDLEKAEMLEDFRSALK